MYCALFSSAFFGLAFGFPGVLPFGLVIGFPGVLLFPFGLVAFPFGLVMEELDPFFGLGDFFSVAPEVFADFLEKKSVIEVCFVATIVSSRRKNSLSPSHNFLSI